MKTKLRMKQIETQTFRCVQNEIYNYVKLAVVLDEHKQTETGISLSTSGFRCKLFLGWLKTLPACTFQETHWLAAKREHKVAETF